MLDKTILLTSNEETKEAKRDRDCLPLPPTPTKSALPLGASNILLMRHTWHIASSNNTRFIADTYIEGESSTKSYYMID